MNRYIKPSALNILGTPLRASASTHSSNVQEESTPGQSLWERIKSGAKRVLGYISQTLMYIRENIVPIATVVASIMNAWSNYQRCSGKARDSACYA